MVEHDPAYGGGHLQLAHVARRRGDVPTARKELLAARGYWRHADADLPELDEIRKELAALGR